MEYEEWKTLAASALSELHGIDPSLIPERVWRQLYIDNHAPPHAAERAATFCTNTRTRHWLLRQHDGEPS